jgi:hypothetical protein
MKAKWLANHRVDSQAAIGLPSVHPHKRVDYNEKCLRLPMPYPHYQFVDARRTLEPEACAAIDNHQIGIEDPMKLV